MQVNENVIDFWQFRNKDTENFRSISVQDI